MRSHPKKPGRLWRLVFLSPRCRRRAIEAIGPATGPSFHPPAAKSPPSPPPTWRFGTAPSWRPTLPGFGGFGFGLGLGLGAALLDFGGERPQHLVHAFAA